MPMLRFNLTTIAILALVGCRSETVTPESSKGPTTVVEELQTVNDTEISRAKLDRRSQLPNSEADTSVSETASTLTVVDNIPIATIPSDVELSLTEINEYQQKIDTTLDQIMKSSVPDGKSKSMAQDLARDLEIEMRLATQNTSSADTDVSRKRIQNGLERLSSILTQPPESK